MQAFVDSFVMEGTAGHQILQEAVEWFFEHGCIGRYVPVDFLGSFLTCNFSMAAKVQVGICKMRSLIVVVDPKHFDKPSARYTHVVRR
jgi:hypothetical protein